MPSSNRKECGGRNVSKFITRFLKFIIVPQSDVVKAGMKSEMQSVGNKDVR